MTELLTQTLPPSDQGLDTVSAHHMMPRGKAPGHRNFLVHRAGMLPMRGAISNHAELSIGSTEIIAGAWEFQDIILVSRVSQDATRVREPWTLPYRPASASTALANPSLTMKQVNLGTLAVSNLTVGSADTVIGGRGAPLGAYVYGFAYANASTTSIYGNVQWKRALLRWDVIGGTLTNLTNAPSAGQAVHTHLDRVWVLGGIDIPGGETVIRPSALYFSIQGGPVANTAAEWKDEATGLVNKIIVDSDNPGDFGVGLAKVGDDLIIFKRRSIHILSGDSPSTYVLRPLTRELGCLDERSIAEYSDGVYWLSDQGFMHYDGEELNVVSTGLENSLEQSGRATVGGNGTDGAKACSGRCYDNYLLYSSFAQNMTNGALRSDPTFAGLLHTPTGRWSEFTSGVLTNGLPQWIGRTQNHSYIIDSSNVIKTDFITLPEEQPESLRGYDHVTKSSNDVKSRINSRWESPVAPLSTYPLMSQIHRLMIDYVFAHDGGTDGDINGWYVSLWDGRGNQLCTEYQVPGMGDPSNFLFRRRDVQDVFTEATDCQVVIEWRDSGGTYPAIIEASLYDATVEFQRTRQRRST